MVMSFGLTDDREAVGYYAGFVLSAFMLGRLSVIELGLGIGLGLTTSGGCPTRSWLCAERLHAWQALELRVGLGLG